MSPEEFMASRNKGSDEPMSPEQFMASRKEKEAPSDPKILDIAKKAVSGEGEFSQLGKRQQQKFMEATSRDPSKAGQVPLSQYVSEAGESAKTGGMIGAGLPLLLGQPEISPISGALGAFSGATSSVVSNILKDLGYKQGMQEAGGFAAGLAAPTNIPIMKNTLSSIAQEGVNKGIMSRASKFLDEAKGKIAQELSSKFGTQIGEKVGGVISKAEEAGVEPAKRLQAVTKAQEELGGRLPVATARQAEKEQTLIKSLDELSPQKGVLPEDLGGVIQQSGRKNIDALKQTRTKEAITDIKDPAFKAARAREAGGDFISTNPNSAPFLENTIKTIRDEIQKTPGEYRGVLEKRLNSIIGESRPLTSEEQKLEQFKEAFQPGYKAKTSTAEPMTMDQAEFLRRMLEKNDLGKIEGFEALDATRMANIGGDLRKAMNAYDDRFGKYIQKYREGSEDITKALGGRGKRLTQTDLANEENVLFSADKQAATQYYLNGSEERAQRLLDLTGGKTPEVVNNVKGYIRSEMEKMDAKQADKFIRDNEGMLRVFPELRTPMNNIAKNKEIVELAPVAAEKKAIAAGKTLEARGKLAERSIEEQQKIVNKYTEFKNKLDVAKPQEAVKMSQNIADNLLRDGAIDAKTHKQLLRDISNIQEQYGKSEKARNLIKKTVYKTVGYGLLGVAGVEGVKSLTGE